MLCHFTDRVMAMSGKLILVMLIATLTGCASNDTRTPDNQTNASQLPAEKTVLDVAKSSSVLNYADTIRTQCMYLFNYTGMELLKINHSSADGIKQALSENENSINHKLQNIRERAVELKEYKLKRPDFALSSPEDFMLKMDDGIADCSEALISIIDKTDSNFIPDEENPLSAEESHSRFNEMIYPQMKVLGMTYAFEVNEYSKYDNKMSAQYQFSLLMQHVYQTLLDISQHHFGNEVRPAPYEYKAALVTYLDLRAKARAEVDTMVGMHFVLQLSSGAQAPETLKSKDIPEGKDTEKLLAEYDQMIAEFDTDFVTLLTALSKEAADSDEVKVLIFTVLRTVVGHELARSKGRKNYRAMMLRVIKMMILLKNK
jgi:hypothetical protein